MHVREQAAKTVEEYAEDVRRRGHGTFQDRMLRDQVFMIVGGTRGISKGVQLHPEYVTDYVGRIESGFGNAQYQTYWSKLYSIDL